MKVAVTGASGHIGLNLIPKLKNKGYKVRLLAHRNVSILESFQTNLIPGDILEKNSLRDFIDGADVVIHLAAIVTIFKKSPHALKVNIDGTRNLLEISRELGVKKFIHLSSIHSLKVFPLDKVLDESRELNLKSPFDYDRSKAESEKMVFDFAGPEFSTVILNPTAVLGPHDYQPSFLGEAIIRYYKGKIPAIMNGGYNWVDVRDVVYAILAAIDEAPSGSKFLIAGHWKSLKELGDTIHRLGGATCPNWIVPFWLAHLGAIVLNSVQSGASKKPLFTRASLDTLQHSHRNISIEKARKELGYSPRPFEESIKDTLQWYKDNKLID